MILLLIKTGNSLITFAITAKINFGVKNAKVQSFLNVSIIKKKSTNTKIKNTRKIKVRYKKSISKKTL